MDSNTEYELQYWKDRCKAAENYIAHSPCDPDIFEDQYNAWLNWQSYKNKDDDNTKG